MNRTTSGTGMVTSRWYFNFWIFISVLQILNSQGVKAHPLTTISGGQPDPLHHVLGGQPDPLHHVLGGQLRWPPSSSFRGSGHWPPSMNDRGWTSLKSTHAGDRERTNPSTLTPYTLYVFLENDGLIALTTLVFQQLWSTLSADHRSLPRTLKASQKDWPLVKWLTAAKNKVVSSKSCACE